MPDTFRVTTYELEANTFTGTTYDITLNNDLESNYFVMINGGAEGNTTRGPSSNFIRVSADPFGTGTLGTSSGADVITLARPDTVDAWIGTICVVECLGDESASGFTLLDVVELNFTPSSSTSDTATSGTAWSDINQVGLYGGIRGGGVAVNNISSAASGAGHARIYPSGSDTINGSRDLTGKTAEVADFTVYVVEWGSEWTIQRVNATGTAGGAGANSSTHYVTGAITSATRDNTFVLGYGHTNDGGIGDSFSGRLVTLGDGQTQNASETVVSCGGEYSDTVDVEIYVHEHADLAVDYVFQIDGNSTALTFDHTVDAALSSETYNTTATVSTTEGYRVGIQYNGCNGTGTAYPRPYWGARHTASTTMNVMRGYQGQSWPAWVQSADFSGITYEAGGARRIFHVL